MGAERERTGSSGLSIAGRFSLFSGLALLVVMSGAGFFLLDKSRKALEQAGRHTLNEAARFMAREGQVADEQLADVLRDVKLERIEIAQAVERLQQPMKASYKELGTFSPHGKARYYPIEFTSEADAGTQGYLVQYLEGESYHGTLLAPEDLHGGQSDALFGLILLVTAALLAVATGVAFAVSAQVTKPIEKLMTDVRSISLGNLHHRTRVRGGGEVHHLARQINLMAESLELAQEARVELGIREREAEVAQEVREALLPKDKPDVEGYRIDDLHVNASEPGGDFHDYILVEGKIVLLVCEVSGKGVPGALVGATARAYLRSELSRGEDIEDALLRINQYIAHDVRRGMYVTALCLTLDPVGHEATLICAGHKLPLIRYEAEGGNVRLVQPEGIALGFDKGPVFGRSLEVLRVPLRPGDRLVMANTGPVRVPNSAEVELGEKGFYRLVSKQAAGSPEEMTTGILTALELRAGEQEFPADISLIVLARES